MITVFYEDEMYLIQLSGYSKTVKLESQAKLGLGLDTSSSKIINKLFYNVCIVWPKYYVMFDIVHVVMLYICN